MFKRLLRGVRWVVFAVLTAIRPLVCLAAMLASRLCLLLLVIAAFRLLSGHYVFFAYAGAFIGLAFAPVAYDLILHSLAPRENAGAIRQR